MSTSGSCPNDADTHEIEPATCFVTCGDASIWANVRNVPEPGVPETYFTP